MSFDTLLIHTVVIQRATAATTTDYGEQTRTWSTLATVAARVQPRDVQEVAQLSDAGAVISDHVIDMRPTDIKSSDRVRFSPDDGRIFEVRGVRDMAGMGHHLLVDAQMVQ